MNEAVTLSISDGIADLRLNRPGKMNAVDEGIMTGLREAVMASFEKREPKFS